MNIFRTMFFMTLIVLLFAGVGQLIGGTEGAIFCLIFAGLMNFFSYWFSDKMVLAMYRAREVSPAEAPRLYHIIERLTTNAGLPMPKVYVIPTDLPNAFATGRNPSHAAVAVTEGIARLLTEDELEGVIAHELSHIKHRDILIATIVATIAGAIMWLAMMSRWALIFTGLGDDRDRGANPIALLVVAIVAPIAAVLIQLAISRSREYHADEGGAQMSRKPLALANALEKIHSYARAYPMNVNPSTAHLFIVNPLKGGGIGSLFSTHPPVEDRIARLQHMAREIF